MWHAASYWETFFTRVKRGGAGGIESDDQLALIRERIARNHEIHGRRRSIECASRQIEAGAVAGAEESSGPVSPQIGQTGLKAGFRNTPVGYRYRWLRTNPVGAPEGYSRAHARKATTIR